MKSSSTVALVVIANPKRYPHIERHSSSLLKSFKEVHVLCVGDCAEFPVVEGVFYHALLGDLPVGMKGFGLFILKAFHHLQELAPDVVEAIDPPGLFPSFLYARKNEGVELIYMSMEYYLEQAHIKNSWRRRKLWGWIEKVSIRRADAFATVSPGVARLLSELYARDFQVVRNLPRLAKEPIEEKTPKSCLRLAYHGLLEAGRGVEKIAEVIEGKPGWVFRIIGGGPLEESLRERFAGNSNIEFTGWLPYEDSLKSLKECDASVVWIEPLGLSFKHCLPGKLFEAIQMEIPVLISDLPDMREVVEEHHVGVVAGFETGDLAKALDLLKSKIEAGAFEESLKEAKENLCWEREEEIFLNLFDLD